MTLDQPEQLPALLGGPPTNLDGLPEWPQLDLKQSPEFEELLKTGSWGKYHAAFTSQLSQRLQESYDLEHVILTSSGTAAVELALRGLKVGEGDEVILAAYDFKANFSNVGLLGATPVLVDVQRTDCQLDVDLLSNALSPKTKAVIASHLHGGVVDILKLQQWASEQGIPIIEDCCQVSPRAKVKGQRLGTIGDVATLSFGGSKLLTSGRGGAVLTNRADVAQRIRLYQQRGNDAYPLSEMQAAVLLPQLRELPELHRRRTECVKKIIELCSEASRLEPIRTGSDVTPDFYKLGFWYDSGSFEGLSREKFCAAMRAEGIPIDPGFHALHRIHAKRRFRASGELKHTDHAHDAIVVLHHPFLLRGTTAAEQFVQALDKIQQHATILKQ